MPTTSAAELRNLSRTELNSKVTELKEELFTLRFSAATGQLESHGRLRACRKDIARIYTVLHERQLGIVDDPDADDLDAEGAAAPVATKTTKRAKAGRTIRSRRPDATQSADKA